MNDSPTPAVPAGQTKRASLPLNVKIGLAIFALTGSVILGLFPHLIHGSKTTTPQFGLLAGAGLATVLLTSVLFAYLGRLRLGFGKTALVLALGYNTIIAFVKIALSPHALYLSNQREVFDATNGNPNSPVYAVIIALLIALLYVAVFRMMYRHFFKRMQARSDPNGRQPRLISMEDVGIYTIAAVGAVGMAIFLYVASALFRFPNPLGYLSYVLGVLGLPIALALGLGVFLAYRSFAAVEKEVIRTGNAALLASFFWLGVSLIALYHIMWIVFLLTLVHIWPFNTYSPK